MQAMNTEDYHGIVDALVRSETLKSYLQQLLAKKDSGKPGEKLFTTLADFISDPRNQSLKTKVMLL